MCVFSSVNDKLLSFQESFGVFRCAVASDVVGVGPCFIKAAKGHLDLGLAIVDYVLIISENLHLRYGIHT